MTRKDYVLIAASIKSALDARTCPEAIGAIRYVACCLADDLRMENPRFDRARFLSACGVN